VVPWEGGRVCRKVDGSRETALGGKEERKEEKVGELLSKECNDLYYLRLLVD